MSRLHKKINFSLIKKYYLAFFLLIGMGFYKNGILPNIYGYATLGQTFFLFLLPFLGLGIGYLFDSFFHNKNMFNSKFYSLLFTMILPIKINIFFYLLFLFLFLFLYNFWVQKNIDQNLNLIVVAKISLIVFLFFFTQYSYENGLEASGVFQYSFLDRILVHNTSGLFTSSIILLLVSLVLFCLDDYYKKEIPLYSYGFFMLTLFLYIILKHNMAFLLLHMLSSNVLFPLIFIAPLSMYSPYTKQGKWLYSFLLGILILPCSLFTNFYEGTYISILLANSILILLNFFIKIQKEKKN